jgi:hypothetical protein
VCGVPSLLTDTLSTVEFGMVKNYVITEQDPALGLEPVIPGQEASYCVYLMTLLSCKKGKIFANDMERHYLVHFKELSDHVEGVKKDKDVVSAVI